MSKCTDQYLMFGFRLEIFIGTDRIFLPAIFAYDLRSNPQGLLYQSTNHWRG